MQWLRQTKAVATEAAMEEWRVACEEGDNCRTGSELRAAGEGASEETLRCFETLVVDKVVSRAAVGLV